MMTCLLCPRTLSANRKAALRAGWREVILVAQRYWLCPLCKLLARVRAAG